MNTDDYTLNFEFRNDCLNDQRLWIEPHAQEYELKKGSEFLICVSGPVPIKRAFPRVELKEDTVVFYIWPGAGFEVYENDKLISQKLDDCFREPLPKNWGI